MTNWTHFLPVFQAGSQGEKFSSINKNSFASPSADYNFC